MVGFIQQKYSSKIALQDIAAAGYVCRSSCCSIFKEYLNQTPNAYLTEYRISKSVELLANPDLSVTEIAMQCGFSGSSYFTETFRKANRLHAVGLPDAQAAAAVNLRQHRTEFVRKMRSRIFRQIAQKFRRHTVGRNQS